MNMLVGVLKTFSTNATGVRLIDGGSSFPPVALGAWESAIETELSAKEIFLKNDSVHGERKV